ncbi:MAG TPA: hypothetical protein VMT94_01140 [Burkholderiales bacterium]|nr:hypothetical protein [Burkholderiales bacterium]
MIIRIIKAVKYGDGDAPVAVIWQHADAAANEWVGDELEADIEEVAAALDQGQTVYLEWFADGRSVQGPQVRKITHASGAASIESVEPDRPLNQLPYFD